MSWTNPRDGTPGPPSRSLLGTAVFIANYSPASGPAYEMVTAAVPSLEHVPLERVSDPTLQLVGVTADISISSISANVQYIGLIGAAFLYYQRLPSAGNYLSDFGNVFPLAWDAADVGKFTLPPEDSVTYDPISLPIGGVNFPIWTRVASDPVHAAVRADQRGEVGTLWFRAMFQVVDSLIEASAAVITVRFKWWDAGMPSRYTRRS